MFLRCERCRALYELDVAPGTRPVVSCPRCQNVFAARHAVTRVSPAGVIGGAAAAPAPEPRPAPAGPRGNSAGVERARRSESAESGGKGALVAVVAVVAVVVAGLGIAVIKLASGPSELAPAVAGKVAAAQAALARDDAASLELAIAAFADAATHAPDHPELKALRAFATVLAGASLKAEATDLGIETARLERRRKELSEEGADAAAKAEVVDRLADAKARAVAAGARGDKLAKEGFELAKAASADAGDDAPEVVRALVLSHAVNQDPERLESVAKRLGDDAKDPWLDYARAFVRTLGNVSPQKAGEARERLEALLAANPQLLRVKFDLARLALSANPPDLDRAERLLGQILLANAAHEGARRGLALVEYLRAAAAAVDAPQ